MPKQADQTRITRLSAVALVLFILQVALYTLLFLEGNIGRGTVVFTVVFSLGSMIAPCLLGYTLLYHCRKSYTAVENLMVYIPMLVLLTSTWFYLMGTLKLFLDQIGKDVFTHVIPGFNTRDHLMTWSLAGLYLIASIQCLRVFHTHVRLVGLAKHDGLRGDSPTKNSGVILLFFCQLALNVFDFFVGLDVLSTENVCAFCIGCAQRFHTTECNEEMSQLACEEAGHTWCMNHEGASFTPTFIISFGLSSCTLGMVFFLMLLHVFGDSEAVVSINNHHKWAIVPALVLVVNAWVCGSGAVRIFMRVLKVQAMDEVYPMFTTFRVSLLYSLFAVYVLHLLPCFYLILAHVENHVIVTQKLNRKQQNERRQSFDTELSVRTPSVAATT